MSVLLANAVVSRRPIVLFSCPTDRNIDRLQKSLFPDWLESKRMAFMPSDGIGNCPSEYIEFWKSLAISNGSDFVLIDNTAGDPSSTAEVEKLADCNILLLSGGNTPRFLRNLRQSGLDKTVKEFSRKEKRVLSGVGAGALVLTPSIEISRIGFGDKCLDGLTDLNGLSLVDFEVYPHYDPIMDPRILDYESSLERVVVRISDDDLVIVGDK
jgi:peptidase E